MALGLLLVGCAEKPVDIGEPPAAASPEATEEASPPATPSEAEPTPTEADPTPTADVTPDAQEDMALPADALAKCRGDEVLAPACPTRLPVLEDSPFQRAQVDKLSGGTLFNFEWSAPYPGLVAKNAPPRFLHLVLQSGDPDKFLPFDWPDGRSPLKGEPPKKRNDALFVGRVKWRGVDGELALAPPFPVGGIMGDHLMFRWTGGDNEYVLSVHAWDDIEETETVLEGLFAGTRFAGP